MTREQYKVLRELNAKKETHLFDLKSDVAKALLELGFVEEEKICQKDDLFKKKTGKILLTQRGKEAFERERKGTFRYWFSNIVSVLALIVSIVALIRSG